MKVKDAVKASIMLYPTIHKTKLDVYEHMFLVIGNGYDWVNGELVAEKRVPTVQKAIEKELNDNFQYDIIKDYSISWNLTEFAIEVQGEGKLIDESTKDSITEKYAQIITDRFKTHLEKKNRNIQIILNAKKIAEEELHYAEDPETAEMAKFVNETIELYPLSEKYSYLLNTPDDIKDDWRDAIIEFCDYLLTSEENIAVNYREKYKDSIIKAKNRLYGEV